MTLIFKSNFYETDIVKLKGIVIWLVCVLFYLYEYLLRTILGTFQQAIMPDLQLSTFDFAILSSTSYLFIYGLMQVPVSSILMRFGVKKALLFASIICAVSTLGFSFCNHYYWALLFRSLMGLGSAFGFICVLVTVYDWMPSQKIALYVGLSQFLGTMGPMVTGGPLNTLAQASLINWRSMFFILSIIGFGLAALIAFVVEKNKQTVGGFTLLKWENSNFKKELFEMLHDRQIWFIAIFCALTYVSIEYLSENECTHFLITKGFSSNFSSYMITLTWLGFALGSPVFGYISDKIRKRKPILLFSSSVTFLSLIFIIYLPLSEYGLMIFFFIFGFGTGAGTVGFVTMGEQFISDKIASGLGLNNAISILFVSLVAPCISYFLMFIAHKSSPYVLIDFQRAFLVLVAFPFLSFIIALFCIKETFAKSVKESLILTINQHPIETPHNETSLVD